MTTLQEMYQLPLVEPDQPIAFVVSARDIRHGVSRDGEHCAIAQAAQRQLGADACRIGPATSTLIYEDRIEVYRTGPDARNLLRLFDIEPKAVSAASISLLPLTLSQRQASRAEYNRARDERKAAGLVPVPGGAPHTNRPRVTVGLRNTTGIRPGI